MNSHISNGGWGLFCDRFLLMKSILFKGGTVVTSVAKHRVDVLVKDGKIAEVGENLSVVGVEDSGSGEGGENSKSWDGENSQAFQIIDCSGKFILPGAIDVHVHLRDPGQTDKEDFESGTRAASAGGVTTVCDMPNNLVPITSREELERKRAIASSKVVVNCEFYMGAMYDSHLNHTNIDEYLASDAIALKVYMGSSTGDLLVDRKEWLEEIFEKAAQANRLVCVHAEDEALMREHLDEWGGAENLPNDPTVHPKIRDDEVAYRAVKEALHLSKKYGTRLHICHLSTQREIEEIRAFKSDLVSFEVTPHHLFLTEADLVTQGNFAKMNPPLRTEENRRALMDAVKEGLADMVATDHAAHTMAEKRQPYPKAPSGVPGLETMLPLLLNEVNQGELTLEDVVRVTSEGPSRVFGFSDQESGSRRGSCPRRGKIEVGMSADLVVVDMELEQVVENGGPGARFTKCGWSAFSGRKLKGWPVLTVVNGEIVFGKSAKVVM